MEKIMDYMPWIIFIGITVLGTIRDSFKMGVSVAAIYVLAYYSVPWLLGSMLSVCFNINFDISIYYFIMLISGVLVLITLIKK